jgi:hypothetical protein
MNTERLCSENILDAFLSLTLKAGMYKGLFLRVLGTNNAGETLLVTDCGILKLQIPGVRESNISFHHLSYRTNMYNGVAEAVSGAGAAFAFCARLDFFKKNDPVNAVAIAGDPKASLQWTFTGATLATKVASGNIEVYAIYDDGSGREKYVPVYREASEAAAAAKPININIPEEEVEELFVINDAHITDASVTRDGKSVVDGRFSSLLAASNANNRLETAITTLTELIAPFNPELQNVRSTSLKLLTDAALTGNIATYVYLFADRRMSSRVG